MSYNFEDILLTNKEKLILFSLRFHKRQEGNIYAPPYNQLFRYDFISPNYYPERGPEGEDLPDGTFSLTDTYKRYRIYIRKQRIHRYMTPIVVSSVTTVVLHILQQLWLPALSNWIRDFF